MIPRAPNRGGCVIVLASCAAIFGAGVLLGVVGTTALHIATAPIPTVTVTPTAAPGAALFPTPTPIVCGETPTPPAAPRCEAVEGGNMILVCPEGYGIAATQPEAGTAGSSAWCYEREGP